MSKRKYREGGHAEEPIGGAPKKIKTGHTESRGAQVNANSQNRPENNVKDIFSAEAEKRARKLAKRERRKADKEERAQRIETASLETKDSKNKKRKRRVNDKKH